MNRARVSLARQLVVSALVVTGLGVGGSVLVAGPADAAATTTLPPQNFGPGGYSVSVPTNATSVHLVGLGAAGLPGQTAPANYGTGGRGGAGTVATEDVPVGPNAPIKPGSVLRVTVGALGGGGAGGLPVYVYLSPEAGAGGAGGGATTIQAGDGSFLIVAGGGGGGGGGGDGNDGGDGGTEGKGQSLSDPNGNVVVAGGAYGGGCTVPIRVTAGGAGETTSRPLSLGGGGGGGGQGYCGGGGGSSGDNAFGTALAEDAGGAGGGAGGSALYGGSGGGSLQAGANTGDGFASVTFTVSNPAPLAPPMNFAVAGQGTGQAVVYFFATDTNGGSPIDHYTITSSPDAANPQGVSVTTPANAGSPATLSGLTPGHTYTFTVTATNTDGLTSPASAPSNPVLVTGPPPSPTDVTAVAGNGQATVSFVGHGDPDGNANGLPITGYTVTSSPDDTHPQGISVHQPPDAGSPATVTGLTNGQAYTFTVTEENSAGASPPSAPSNSVTPTAAPATATLSASSIDFGGQLIGGTSQPQFVTLTNDGDLPLSFAGLGMSGANPGDFVGDLGTCGGSVAPHTSCRTGATFKPSAAGPRSATLLVYDGAADSPQQISLTGTGQAPATVTLSASSIDFGGQLIGGTSQPQYVTVTNNGDLPLSFAGLGMSGANPGDFVGNLGTCGVSIAPHTSCRTGAAFKPTAAGPRSATLLVNDSAGDSPQQIKLTGTGVASLSVSTVSPLPGATVGALYHVALAAAGGTTPYSWSLASGSSLPAGLTLHPDGIIDGTPTQAGPGSFTVQVSDASGPAQTTSKSLTLPVNPPPQADLKIANAHVGSFVAGRNGSYQLQVTNTGNAATTGTITVSDRLPAGLAYAGASGPGWVCHATGQTATCTHAGSLAPGISSQVAVLVRITVRPGSTLTSTATVSPTDSTPGDNTATDSVTVQRK